MRILIVENEKALANNLKRRLSEEGYSADVAYDGEEGGFMAGRRGWQRDYLFNTPACNAGCDIISQ